MVKVSICIPVYKDLIGLQRLLNSIKKQDFDDFELIITDDTPDESIENFVTGTFGKQIVLDSGVGCLIKYYHNEIPLGAAGNWNYSIGLAEGEYIKIMHQDDFFTDSDSLSSFVKLLDDAPAAILGFSGSRQVTIKKNSPQDLSEYYDRYISAENLDLITKDWRNLFLGGFIGAPSAVIYRNCDKKFDPELSWLIDSDFYMNLLKDNGNSFAYTTNPLVCIGVSETQLTNECINNSELNIREHKHLYTKYELGSVKEYQIKLADTVIEYKGKYDDISDTGLDKELYKNRLSGAKKERRRFLFRVILRKLHLTKAL